MAAKSALAALLLCGGIQAECPGLAGLKLRRGVNTRALGRHVPLPTRVTSQGRRMGMRRKGLAPRAESLAGLPDFLPYPSLASAKETVTWIEGRGMPGQVVNPSMFGDQLRLVAAKDVPKGEPVLTIPSSACITRDDVDKDPMLSKLTKGQDTITALALWIMKERALGEDSEWSPYFKTLPLFTYSPITWTPQERATYLRGSFVLREANQRVEALEAKWINLAKIINDNDETFGSLRSELTLQSFLDAFSVVLAHSVTLENANQIALVPLAEFLPRIYTPKEVKDKKEFRMDYDPSLDAVTLLCSSEVKQGSELYISEEYGLSNSELLLSRGLVKENNDEDFIPIEANIVMADVLYGAKKEILQAYGFGENHKFVVYRDRLPLELLSYLRLSRLSNTDDLLKLNFEVDKAVSEMNEYEILQLLLSEARTISGGFAAPDQDTDRFILRNPETTIPAKLGAVLRMGEKQVISSFMDAVRTRLAPIRGIPTKKGMENQNQEIIDMFDTFESIPKAPQKLVKDLKDWWTDENNWKDQD